MITFIVPTTGRPSLIQTLHSIECWPGDEVLVVGGVKEATHTVSNVTFRYLPCPPGGDWGHAERNWAMPQVTTRYMAHIDDDDFYVPGARRLMDDAIKRAPDRPVIFRMRAPNGVTLWREECIVCGNVGTPQFLIPNIPVMLGTWGPFVGGDCHFLETCKWKPEDYVWRPEVICLVGHNWG